MAASDALIVREDWISEHDFTTDAKSESSRRRRSSAGRPGTRTARASTASPACPPFARGSSPPAASWELTSPTCWRGSPGRPTTVCPTCTTTCGRSSATRAGSTCSSRRARSSASAPPTWPRTRR